MSFLLVARCAIAGEPGPACESSAALEVDGLGTPSDDLARVAELAGAVAPSPRLIRRGGVHAEALCNGVSAPWLSAAARTGGETGLAAVPLRLASTWSSTYPSGQNDGLLWAGRGLSQELSGGVAIRFGVLSAALAPEVAWSENRAFPMVPTGRTGQLSFGNSFYGDGIDLPQRFGRGPHAAWSPGQSWIRADLWNVGVGFSTENLWLGPGIRSSILMSNAGPGFPHVFIGTSRPADVRIGKAEAFLFWGRLERTPYVSNGGHPLVSGLAVTYGPRWTPGLTFGLVRTMLQPWDRLRARDYLAVFQTFKKEDLQSWYGPGGDNPRDNQLASVFGRWVFPESGLEIYAEWAREDHEWDWSGLVREPDHSAAYLLGLQKVFRAGERLVRVHAEATHLQEIRPLGAARGTPVYYVHGNDLGYTNAGQPLGAWIGPGGDSQTLAVDVFDRGGRIGGYLERVRRNDAYFWAVIEPAIHGTHHDVELTGAVRQVLHAGRLEVGWEGALSWRQNRDFHQVLGFGRGTNEWNVRLGLSIAAR